MSRSDWHVFIATYRKDFRKTWLGLKGASILYGMKTNSKENPRGRLSWSPPSHLIFRGPSTNFDLWTRWFCANAPRTLRKNSGLSRRIKQKKQSLLYSIFRINCAGTNLTYKELHSGQYVSLCKKNWSKLKMSQKKSTSEGQKYWQPRLSVERKHGS